MIEYNIHYTKDKNGKRIARQQYYAADGTKKYIQAKTATALKQKLEEKFKNRPLVKFNPNQYTIDDAEILFKGHLIYKRGLGKTSQSCIEDYDSFYKNHIKPFFENKDLRMLQSEDVAAFVKQLKSKGYKTKTIKKIFNHFKNIITYLADEKNYPNIINEKNTRNDFSWRQRNRI